MITFYDNDIRDYLLIQAEHEQRIREMEKKKATSTVRRGAQNTTDCMELLKALGLIEDNFERPKKKRTR